MADNTIQFFWDGTSGACINGNKKGFFTSKPSLVGVSYDTLVYDSTDSIALRTFQGVTSELTPVEIAVVVEYCESHSNILIGDSIKIHNEDTTAHHDIRVQLSNLHEFSHKVATVWATELQFTPTTKDTAQVLPWNFVAHDITDCTVSDDSTLWKCPVSESYDIGVFLNIFGQIKSGTKCTISVYKKGANGGGDTLIGTAHEFTLTYDATTNSSPIMEYILNGVVLAEGDKLYVSVLTDTDKGALISVRNYLTVDNHGSSLAIRKYKYLMSTVGSLINLDNTQVITYKNPATNTLEVTVDNWNPTKITQKANVTS